MSSQLGNLNKTYTLFAPSNAAFQQFFFLQSRPKSCLNALALNHVVNDTICTTGTDGKKYT